VMNVKVYICDKAERAKAAKDAKAQKELEAKLAAEKAERDFHIERTMLVFDRRDGVSTTAGLAYVFEYKGQKYILTSKTNLRQFNKGYRFDGALSHKGLSTTLLRFITHAGGGGKFAVEVERMYLKGFKKFCVLRPKISLPGSVKAFELASSDDSVRGVRDVRVVGMQVVDLLNYRLKKKLPKLIYFDAKTIKGDMKDNYVNISYNSPSFFNYFKSSILLNKENKIVALSLGDLKLSSQPGAEFDAIFTVVKDVENSFYVRFMGGYSQLSIGNSKEGFPQLKYSLTAFRALPKGVRLRGFILCKVTKKMP